MYNTTELIYKNSKKIKDLENGVEYDIDAFSREIAKIQKKSLKILIIYNNKDLCKTLETYLIEEGHDCICAVNGRNGLSLIESEKFDIVLLGLMMPEFSRYDIIDILEKNGKLKETNIIVLSSVHIPQSEIEDLLKRGVYSYLRQPVKPDVLLRILENSLDMKTANTVTALVSELKCPFCHDGIMREDSCGCLTCRKCHRVEGTNCNISGCQNARFSTCS